MLETHWSRTVGPNEWYGQVKIDGAQAGVFVMVSSRQREVFDSLLDEEVASLPTDLQGLLEEVPLIVEDEPGDRLLAALKLDRRRTELCGLHWAVPLTEKSVWRGAEMPGRMMLFRGPIIRLVTRAGGGREALRRQIRITMLHEIGHHFGLNEENLAELGYG